MQCDISTSPKKVLHKDKKGPYMEIKYFLFSRGGGRAPTLAPPPAGAHD